MKFDSDGRHLCAHECRSLTQFEMPQIIEKFIKIRACIYISAKREAQIVKAEFCVSNSNFIQSEL